MKKGDYFCPQCGEYFDTPKAWISPCCGVETLGGDDNCICPHCNEEFEEDMEIPQCPYCDNTGSGMVIQPDCVDCFRDDDREQIRKLRGLNND